MNFLTLLNGKVDFDDSEEYLEFRFRLLNAVMLTGIFFSALFVAIDLAGINSLGYRQLVATEINCAASIALFLSLRGHKKRFLPVATLFVAVNFLTFLSALVFALADELRVIWFFVCLITVYILLGVRAGIGVTLLTIVCIVFANRLIDAPFSGNAMTTLLISLSATSVISCAYTLRTLSFFDRMRATTIKLRELAEKDPLTGVYNQRAYYQVTHKMISLAQRNGKPYSLLFIDLDHFKAINDGYGHEIGDAVLRNVAATLVAQLRQSDVLGRIGGEEFSVFLPDTPLAGATALGEKLRKEIAQHCHRLDDGQALCVTVSIGVAGHRLSDRSIADIQRRADRFMYQAKRQGRNQTVAESDPLGQSANDERIETSQLT